jgi:hypothetical protein
MYLHIANFEQQDNSEFTESTAGHTYLSIILLVTPGELHFVPQDATYTFYRPGESEQQDNGPKQEQTNHPPHYCSSRPREELGCSAPAARSSSGRPIERAGGLGGARVGGASAWSRAGSVEAHGCPAPAVRGDGARRHGRALHGGSAWRPDMASAARRTTVAARADEGSGRRLMRRE